MTSRLRELPGIPPLGFPLRHPVAYEELGEDLGCVFLSIDVEEYGSHRRSTWIDWDQLVETGYRTYGCPICGRRSGFKSAAYRRLYRNTPILPDTQGIKNTLV